MRKLNIEDINKINEHNKPVLYIRDGDDLYIEFVQNEFTYLKEGQVDSNGREIKPAPWHTGKFPWSEREIIVLHEDIRKLFKPGPFGYKAIKSTLEENLVDLKQLKGVKLKISRAGNEITVKLDTPCIIDIESIDKIKKAAIFSKNIMELHKATRIRLSRLKLLKQSGFINFEVQSNIS